MQTDTTCLLCGQTDVPWMTIPCDWRAPSKNTGPYPLRWCEQCQFGALQPRPNPEQIADFYAVDGYYTHTAKRNRSRSGLVHKIASRLGGGALPKRQFEQIASRVNVNSVCEIGCGSGNHLAKFIPHCDTVIGVEPDPAARRMCEQRGVMVLDGTAESLPDEITSQRFDMVLMCHVLEHCIDPVQAVSNVVDILNPGGVFICEVPNNGCVGLKRAGIAWPWLDVPRHINFFTEASLRRICEQAGLSIEQVGGQGYSRQFSGDWIDNEWRAIDAFKIKQRPASRWRLLAQTARTRPGEKFDSVRVLATVPIGGDAG